ncbi:MAG: hypothetical protein WCH44_11735 [Betaproteobacteria bacterium]
MQNTTDKIRHHEMTAEWVDDEQGRVIMLTQSADGYHEPNSVLVNPWQLRAVCEQYGLIASDAQAARTIAMLTRRLLVLRDRIDHLGDYLTNQSDHDHANLDYELTYIVATAEIADEFCADLPGAQPQTTVRRPAPAPAPANLSVKPSAKPAAEQASLL